MIELVEANDRLALATALADAVAAALAAALARSGHAAMAVPGGTTPAAFLTDLGRRPIDWAKVSVTLTDERRVPADHPRSNRRLLDQTLFAGGARAAVYVAPDDPAIEAILPLDVCVLGMGEDLHTASLFPGGDRLADALSADCPVPFLAIRAPGAPEDRITLTAPVLTGAAHVFVLIHGAEKRAALARAEAASGPAEAPIRLVMDSANPAIVYWAP